MSPIKIDIQSIAFIFLLAVVSSCAGPPITTWKSKSAKYEWGSVHAWMSKGLGENEQRDEVLTHVLFDFRPSQKSVNDNCRAYLHNMTLIETSRQETLLNLSFGDRAKGTGENYRMSQINLFEN